MKAMKPKTFGFIILVGGCLAIPLGKIRVWKAHPKKTSVDSILNTVDGRNGTTHGNILF